MPLKYANKLPVRKLRSGNLTLKICLQRFLQVIAYSIFSYLTFTPVALAGPDGGKIVGGTGAIDINGLTTNINQLSSSMAIDWNSYNLGSDEIVNYLQPGSSSISLNRILGGDASLIHGQINANGQVVLVNPSGIFFGQNASVNVGGLIASGLNIDPVDFMNGDYIFKEVIGTGGTVINSGLINASLGGNVTLLGKQVNNEGVINARLGAVNMAAGKEAVLTFDNQGLIGVRVSKEILQDELGVDPAVLNSGEITANGGRVLLTGSVSRDVFSEAVNHDDIEQATSVVMHDDGSFTLGGGADVVNSGAINVSSSNSSNAGQVVMLGENITHTGSINANSESGLAGMVELHSMDTTELKGDALISAQATVSGSGGQIKLLGDKVGLFDTTEVNASGIHDGGEVLVGGDRQGLNAQVRNAEFLYLGPDTNIFADAITTGNGGKVVTYANDTGRFHGGIYARGGALSGDGGFVETSGKKGFEIPVAPDVSAVSGQGGLWLIDPYNITISDADVGIAPAGVDPTTYTSIDLLATIAVATIETALVLGDVEIITGGTIGDGNGNGDIIFDADLDYDGTGTNALTLNAAGGITFAIGSFISDSNNTGDSLHLNLYANDNVTVSTASTIDTQGGNFTAGGGVNNTPTSFTNNGTIDTSGIDSSDDSIAGGNAGNISITVNGDVISTSLTAVGGENDPTDNRGDSLNGANGGNITINADSVAFSGALTSSGSAARYDDNSNAGGATGGNGGAILITANTGNISTTDIIVNGGDAAGEPGEPGNGGNAGNITLESQAGAGAITLSGSINSSGGDSAGSGTAGNKSDLFLDGSVTLANSFTLDVNSFSSGDLNAAGATDATGSDIDITSATNITTGAITTSGGTASASTAGNNGGSIALDATNNISINGAINSSGSAANAVGTGGDAGLVNLLSGGQTSVSDITASGGNGVAANGSAADITITTQTLNFNGAVAQTVSGKDVLITASNGVAIQQSLTLDSTNNATLANGSNIDYNGVGATGFLTIRADNNVLLDVNVNDTVADTDQLAVTLAANDDASGGGDVDIEGSIDTNGSDFTATGVNYDAQSTLGTKFVLDTGVGNATINMTGTAALGEVLAGGDLGVSATGNITQGSANADDDDLVVSGTTTLNANGNDIILDSSGNDFADVGFTATDVTLVDMNNIQINTSSALGTLVVTANGTGSITQVGNLLVTAGDSILTANGGDITLASTDNNFSTVILDAVNVDLQDIDTIDLGTSTITGTLAATANAGDITQSGLLDVTGDSNLSATGSIDLDGFSNSFSTVLSNGVNISLRDADSIDLGASTVAGALTVTAEAGNITQSGLLDVTGDSNLTATGNIDLEGFSNTFSTLITDAVNVSLRDADSIDLGATTATGTFTATAEAGNITQSGLLDVLGDTTLNASGDVDLAGFSNLFSTVLANGVNIYLEDVDSIDLGTSLATGTLTVTANGGGGEITQSGDLTVTGLTTLNALDNDITLDRSGNNFGTVAVSGEIVSLRDADSIDLSASTVTDTLTVTADGGNITQSGLLDVNSDTSLTATGDIALDGFANRLATVLADGVNVSLRDTDSIDLGASTITGTLDVTALGGGDITQSEVIDVNGLASFSVNGANSIDLGGFANNFRGGVSFLANSGTGTLRDVSVRNSTTLDLGAINVSRYLAVAVDNGQITNSGTLAVGGVGLFDAGANDVTLDIPTNNFNDIVIINAGNATINDINSINIGTMDGTSGVANVDSNITGDLTITTTTTSGGNITDNDNSAIIVGGVSNFDVAAGNVILDSSTNSLTTANIVKSQNVTLVNSSGIGLQSTAITGNLDVTADGNITNPGALNVTGASSLITTDGNSIAIGNTESQLDGLITFDVTSGSLANVSVANSLATNVQLLPQSNSLNINSGGAITQTGAFDVTGTTTLSAINGSSVTQDITLIDPANNFNELIVSDAADLTLVDSSGDLTLNNINVSGSAMMSAMGDINTNVVTANDTISLTTPGSVNDVNGDSLNLTSNLLEIRSVSGIGGAGDPLNTQVGTVDIINSGDGSIYLKQTGDVILQNLKSESPDNEIELFASNDISIKPGAVEVDRLTGSLVLTAVVGDILGDDLINLGLADITALNSTYNALIGTVGTAGRPITIDVPNINGVVRINALTSSILFTSETPATFESTAVDIGAFSVLSAIAGEQLIEIESLGDIDPAIFTGLRSYSHEDVSIRMPSDQLFEDELEEEIEDQASL